MGQRLGLVVSSSSGADRYSQVSEEDSFLASQSALSACYTRLASSAHLQQQAGETHSRRDSVQSFDDIYLELKEICSEDQSSVDSSSCDHREQVTDTDNTTDYLGSHPQSPTDILSSERNFQHMLDSKSEALSAVITNSIISGNYRLARENMKQLYLQPTIDSHRAVILDKGSLTDLPRSIIRQQTTVPPTLRQLIRRIRLSSKKSSRSNCNLYEEDKENRERDHLLKH